MRNSPIPPRTRPLKKTPLKRRGKSAAKRKRRAFGPQAERCRRSPCCNCHAPPPSDPHHVPSLNAGGTDADAIPACRPCHRSWHDDGPWMTHEEVEAVKEAMRA